MQPLEDYEDLLGELRRDTDAVVGDAELPHPVRSWIDGDLHGGGAVGRPEFDAIADEVLPQHREQGGVAHYLGHELGPLYDRTGLLDDGSEAGECGVQHPVELQEDAQIVGPAYPGEGQQVVDQDLQPLGAVDCEVDVLAAPLVQLVAVALLQELAERGHLAQRFLQVMGGHIGELLEIGVGAQEVGCLGIEVLSLAGRHRLGSVGTFQCLGKLIAHRLDVRRHGPQILGAGRLDAVAEIAPHHMPGGGAQAAQRLDDRVAQYQRQHG